MYKALLGLLFTFAILVLSACNRNSRAETAAVDDSVTSAPQEVEVGAASNTESASALDSSYEGALPPTNQIVLGVFQLEDTNDAVTGAQAATMLPLWQALQSGSIQNPSERAAILRQIEDAFTDTQIEAIGAMQLTFTDLNDWAQANGIELPQFGQGAQQGRGGPGGRGGGALADMSAEERAAFRQEMQDLSPEERRERLQEMGVEIPEGGFQGGGGQGGAGAGGLFGALMAALIELLQSKAVL